MAVIGAAGYIGSKVIDRLLKDRRQVEQIVAIDVREVPSPSNGRDVVYDVLDMRSAELSERFREHGVNCVVHLASVVSPPPTCPFMISTQPMWTARTPGRVMPDGRHRTRHCGE